jgi:hypothetical protein
MKTLFTILAFTFLSFTAQAGEELDKFKQDVDALFFAQKANSNQIITYADEKGYLVKTVLNPERYGRMIDESPSGFINIENYNEKYKETFEKFTSTINYFLTSFKQQHGKYDEEYLDSFEIVFRLALDGAKLVKKVTFDKNKTDESRASAESVIEIVSSAPKIIIYGLGKDIADEKFSMLFTPIAEKRLEKLRDLVKR